MSEKSSVRYNFSSMKKILRKGVADQLLEMTPLVWLVRKILLESRIMSIPYLMMGVSPLEVIEVRKKN